MTGKLYDLWPQHCGKQLLVITPRHRFEGVLLGVRSMVQRDLLAPRTELPWALLTNDGVEFVDPDNEAVAIYGRQGLIGLPSGRTDPHLAQAVLSGLLRRSNAVVANARAFRRGACNG